MKLVSDSAIKTSRIMKKSLLLVLHGIIKTVSWSG
jgi:hypothetical protein